MRRFSLLLSALTATTLVASACEEPRAWGEWNSIIAGVSNERWSEIQDIVYSALEPRIFTVRPEKMFRVTQQDPREEDWNQLQRFRQLLLIGSADEPWVAKALTKLDQDTFDPPELLQAEDVWAQGQRVSILLLSPTGGAEEVATLLDPLSEMLDGQYRQWVLKRMFMTPPDTALADSLEAEAGFRLLVPEVYYWRQTDSVYVFRNDNPDPSELIRQVTVSWRDVNLSEIGEQDIIAWREEVQESHFSYPQVVDTTAMRGSRMQRAGLDFYELRGIWENPAESFPAAGPFITRAVGCPALGRTYFIDAWLYAPSREKYQYMIQLETILDTFRCGEAAEGA
ncbi:MAG: hypothetical protein BMS9Abin29_0795 [Gemmatimonadota bacterium]|nr:MAG: hypothetical protein BMS9Abin29_0795 [Gemmatimonadota bacterium]